MKQGDRSTVSGVRGLGATLLETRSRRALAGQTNTQASATDGAEHMCSGQSDIRVAWPAEHVRVFSPVLRLRFREVWLAARFSRSLRLKQRLLYVDGTVRVKQGDRLTVSRSGDKRISPRPLSTLV